MKIIDEHGKLFNFINIVDLIVLVLIIALAGGLVYRSYNKTVNNPAGVAVEQDDVYITVRCRIIPEEAPLGLSVGDKLVAKNAFTTGEVVSVTYEASDYTNPNSDGLLVLTKHPIWKDAVVVLKDKVNHNSPIIKVGGQEARIGFQFIVKTQTVEMVGSTIGIEFK